MKIRVKIGDLVEQVTQAAITVDHKSTDTPLGKVYLRSINRPMKETATVEPFLYLFSSDKARKTFIKIKIEEIVEEGKVLIDTGKLLGALLGRDPTQIAEIAVLNNPAGGSKVRVKVGKNVAHIPYDGAFQTHDATIKELPRPEATIGKIQANSLLGLIRKTWFCMPKEDNAQQRYAMSVLNLSGKDGNYIGQSTDGCIVARHLAKQSETTTCDLPSILIPSGAIDPLQKLLGRHKDEDIDILEGQKNQKNELQEIFFQMGDTLFGTVLRVGKSPNLELLLSDHQPTFAVKVKKDELKQALDRAVNFVENQADRRVVKLTTLDDKTLLVEAAGDPAVALDLKDELDLELASGSFKGVIVPMSIDYLANIVSVTAGDHVVVGLNAAKERAVVITDSSDGLEACFAVMPIKPEKAAKTKAKEEPTDEQ